MATTTRKTPDGRSGPRRRPQRTCVVCRSAQDKRTLIRLTRAPDGTVAVDPSGKGPGRGAYLCTNPRCWSDDKLAQRLGRALRTGVSATCMDKLAEFAATLVKDAADGATGDRT